MFVKILLPLLLPVLTALIPTISADAAAVVAAFVAANPQVAAYIVAGLWFVFHILPSPIQDKVTSKDLPKVVVLLCLGLGLAACSSYLHTKDCSQPVKGYQQCHHYVEYTTNTACNGSCAGK
jgi:hypothetical protein